MNNFEEEMQTKKQDKIKAGIKIFFKAIIIVVGVIVLLVGTCTLLFLISK